MATRFCFGEIQFAAASAGEPTKSHTSTVRSSSCDLAQRCTSAIIWFDYGHRIEVGAEKQVRLVMMESSQNFTGCELRVGQIHGNSWYTMVGKRGLISGGLFVCGESVGLQN
jgi:hypothetical protein